MKLKILILLTAIAMTFGWQAGAQINVAPVILTNLIRTPDSLRGVNGQIYNIKQSVLWETLEGKCLNVSTNGIVVSILEPIYGRADEAPWWLPHSEELGMNPSQQVRLGERETGKIIFLTNYPTTLMPAMTKGISFRAMQTGTISYNREVLELWDYGTTPTQDELRKLKDEAAERQKAAEELLKAQRRVAAEKAAAAKMATQAKIVKWNQEQADKGDPTGLLRMGELYRDGNGVPKDLNKAREYFTKAANAGSTTAADELSKLNQVSTNSPATQ